MACGKNIGSRVGDGDSAHVRPEEDHSPCRHGWSLTDEVISRKTRAGLDEAESGEHSPVRILAESNDVQRRFHR